MPTDVSGRLLLTIPGCSVECAGKKYNGTLALEYVAVAPTGQLVLRVGAWEMLVPREKAIVQHRAQGSYVIRGTPAPATLRVPLVAPNAAARVVLDAFGVLLARFGVVHEAEGGSLAGRRTEDPLANGQIVNELSGSLAVRIVVLDNQPASPELHVRALLPEETAGLLRSAHMVSRGVVLATTTLAAGVALASSSFVARTAPSSTPVVFSAVTRRNIAGAHALSAAVVTASAQTTELILHVVDHTAEYVAPGPPPPAAPRTGIAALAPSADLVLATLAESGAHLMTHGTRALASSLGHRYGADVGDAVLLGSEAARNVAAVYSDARSVGQHALLVRVGQRVASTRISALFDTNADAPPAV